MSPDKLFGIAGLTIGGVGVWALVLLAVLAIARYWVIGMPDRRRADIEGESAADVARAHLFAQMGEQMDRMSKEIASLKQRVAELELNERNNLTELIQLRGAGQVESRVRQRTQEIVSADRVQGAN